MAIFKGRRAGKYIFFEMLPGFLLGVGVFVFILLMFQALRLTEFVLVHGVKVQTVGQICLFLTISFLPAILPMALLFSVIMAYGRLSADSEIVALKAAGLSTKTIALPALFLAILVAFFSARTSFYTAPWGNRQFELLVTELGNTKAGATIREGTFSEGLFDLVVYANRVDSKTGKLDRVFIYDERNEKQPITIISKSGILLQDENMPGHMASLRLIDGNIHRTADTGTYTKIDFSTYDINLFAPQQSSQVEKSPPSLTLDDIRQIRSSSDASEKQKFIATCELHKRAAISVICLLFGLIGVGLGIQPNRRSGKSSGAALSLGVIILYWILFVAGETMAQKHILPPYLAYWIGNLVFFIFAAFQMKKVWN